ncbi:MAG TPA: FAD:protein FMN transferase [Acidimicrobiia bacterium]|nr:FAD:protein FMN transferase [Acidimicrobiia bacterium]
MIEGRFPAMGTQVVVVAPRPDSVDAVLARFVEVERTCSRFLPDSELSRVNKDSATSVILFPLLAEVMACADDLRHRTEGLVDPAMGGHVEAWGYDRTFAEVTGLATSPIPVPKGDWEIQGHDLHRTPGTRLDLGGIAKGWTCDRAVERTEALVVNAGGDLRSADPGLTVTVEDPWGNAAAEVDLGLGGLATSTIAHRAWKVGSGWANHLIDPRTLRPAEGPVVSATAVATTAVEAEAAAKAVLLLGEEGLGWASRQPWIRGALVVWRDGRVFATTGLRVRAA